MTILDKFNLKDRVAIVTGGGGNWVLSFVKPLLKQARLLSLLI